MASVVVPTVLATNVDEYVSMLDRALQLSNRVHIDISDGKFTDQQTIAIQQINPADEYDLDLHLMVLAPMEYIDTAISLKPHLIIIHAEAAVGESVRNSLLHCRQIGIKVGIALLPQTQPANIEELIRIVDHVLIFTGELGHNGGEFNTEQLAKVDEIRKLNSAVEISVDGGVRVDNAALIQLQGVDVLYVGSALQAAENPQETFDALCYQSDGKEL